MAMGGLAQWEKPFTYGDQPAPHAPLCCAILMMPLDESSHAKCHDRCRESL